MITVLETIKYTKPNKCRLKMASTTSIIAHKLSYIVFRHMHSAHSYFRLICTGRSLFRLIAVLFLLLLLIFINCAYGALIDSVVVFIVLRNKTSFIQMAPVSRHKHAMVFLFRLRRISARLLCSISNDEVFFFCLLHSNHSFKPPHFTQPQKYDSKLWV